MPNPIPGGPTPDRPALDPFDQQAHALAGLGHGPTGLGVFQLTDVARFRAWLAGLQPTTLADPVEGAAAVRTNVVFGATGLEKLGWPFVGAMRPMVKDPEYGSVDVNAFAMGGAWRAAATDTGHVERRVPYNDPEDPRRWRWGWREKRPDVALVVAAPTRAQVEAALEPPPGTVRLALHPGTAGANVLGYADGLAQPAPDVQVGGRWLAEGAAREDVRPVGDFLVGAFPRDVPVVVEPPAWAHGGSLLACRVFELDGEAFEAALASWAAATGLDVETVAAHVMGRSRDGTPDRRRLPDGRRADGPLPTSHVHRANPRDGAPARDRPRLLRRGFVDGRTFVFLAYQASLETQFEHVWEHWIRGPIRGEPEGRRDAFLGGGPRADAREVMLGEDAQGVPRTAHTAHRFAVSVAGEYFFLPTVSLLRRIAEGPVADERPQDPPAHDGERGGR